MFTDTQVLLRAMQYAKSFGYTLWIQPCDYFLSRGGVAHSGAVAGRLGLSGVPVMAETVALHTIFELMAATGARVHLCRMSSAAGLELLKQARKDGLAVSADVAVHHLHLIDIDIGYFDPNMRVDPPFRAQRDRDALRAALQNGVIDASLFRGTHWGVCNAAANWVRTKAFNRKNEITANAKSHVTRNNLR